MGILLTCPVGSEGSDIYVPTCFEDFGKIEKIVFQRRLNSGSLNSFTIATANPNVLASWTPLLAASDDTKVVPTPRIDSVNNTPGEFIEEGGGNESVGGIPDLVAIAPTTFEGIMKRMPQRVMEDLESWQSEDAGIYLIDEFGNIGGLTDDHTTPTIFKPIPLRNFVVGDKQFGGFQSFDSNPLKWYFYPRWSRKFHVVKPATGFNPLDEIVAP